MSQNESIITYYNRDRIIGRFKYVGDLSDVTTANINIMMRWLNQPVPGGFKRAYAQVTQGNKVLKQVAYTDYMCLEPEKEIYLPT
jgi:hypothetical protein